MAMFSSSLNFFFARSIQLGNNYAQPQISGGIEENIKMEITFNKHILKTWGVKPPSKARAGERTGPGDII